MGPPAWSVDGHDVMGDNLPDMGFQLDADNPDGPSEQPAIHPLLRDSDFWPLLGCENPTVNLAGTAAGPVKVEDCGSVATPAQQASDTPLRASPQDGGDVEESSATAAEFTVRLNKQFRVELPRSTLINPRSCFAGYTPPLPPTRERHALASLLELVESVRDADGEFVEIELDSFVFYIDTPIYTNEMRPLHHMDTKNGHSQFYLDGILRVGESKHYVQRVAVAELPIGNYGASYATTRGQIWVRSRANARREVYYRLNAASTEYERYYVPFLWVADLAKHVVDYSAAMLEAGREVDTRAFEAHFASWLHRTHGDSPEFRRWRQQHPRPDYRTAVVANISFIWKEMNGVLGEESTRQLPLFREALHFTQYKPTAAPLLPKDKNPPPTIVTPYIKKCFDHMVLGKVLRVVEDAGGQDTEAAPMPSGAVRPTTVSAASTSFKRLPSSKRHRTGQACFLPLRDIDQIKVGDTISTPPDGDSTDTRWRYRGAVHDERWFGLVQGVHIAADGSRSFDVTWFYKPVETPCCMMRYPWPDELFLSDHCTCGDGRHARVKEHEVLAVHDVDWFGRPGGGREFFVRQMYVTEHRRWVTLQKSHMACSHSHSRRSLGFRTGDAVLAVLSKSGEFSDPCEVVKIFKQGDHTFVRVRQLLRRSQFDKRAPPNELVYTDQLTVVNADAVLGKCAVRFFRPGEEIPVPYDRRGTGNLFFITRQLETRDDGTQKCVPFAGDFPASLRQGFDPARPMRKLRGMDLFCGSGNFGRGLEEGGAVEMRWANDIWDKAIHTYMANRPDPQSVRPFFGSVDDLLRLALEGKFSDHVPRPGEVDFIAAGSPCPGFSLLTIDKTTPAQVKNQSLVASFASFVDFYRPKYGVLENVTTIIQAQEKSSEDVLSQLFCAIVGLGYQAQLVLGDAWAHGAPQNRDRVFLLFAAPGVRLPDAPMSSHSHHPCATKRNLGALCNGEPFVCRSFAPTPFQYISAAEATADLPLIGDGKAEPGAPAFPDHRVCGGVTARLRHQIAAIPTRPYGMSFTEAWSGGHGVMSPADRALFPPDGTLLVSRVSKAWSRARPRDVFLTVTTGSQPVDARASTRLHWADPRPLSVLEVRRAQGFPDGEVLLGSPPDQWRLIGNSVARPMALALGLKFREAWAATLRDAAAAAADREGSETVWGSASVSVRAASVVEETSRRSTPRVAHGLSADAGMELSPPPVTSYWQSHSHRDGFDVVSSAPDLEMVDGRPSRSYGAVDQRAGWPSSAPLLNVAETAGAGSGRKRSLSQAVDTEAEDAQPPEAKFVRLESGHTNIIPGPEAPDSLDGLAALPLAWRQGEEAMVEGSGPTIVQL